MKATLVSPQSRLVGSKARCCGAKVRAGESVLEHRLDTRDYADPLFVAHVDCVREMCDSAPSGMPARKARRAFDDIRAQVASTGDIFAHTG